MCHILRTLAGIGEIDEVYAYCSDERICEYLPQGVRFLRRSPDLDRDTTLGREIYDSFTADVEADLYVLAHATSPFIRAETVADALRHVRSGEYDSAFSAEKIQTFAWFEGRPLNYALDDIPRTQTIEPVYIETSAFFIFPRTLWCGRGRRIGEKPLHGRRRPHRRVGHRQPRGFHDGRDHRGKPAAGVTGADGKRKRNLQRPKTRIEKRKCCNLGDYAASGYSRQRKYNLRPVTTYFPDMKYESDLFGSLSYFLKRGKFSRFCSILVLSSVSSNASPGMRPSRFSRKRTRPAPRIRAIG